LKAKKILTTIGWREWLELPDLDIPRIKVKVDTGARTSALHVYDLEEYHRGDQRFVRFLVHPLQRSTKETIHCKARVLEERKVRDSGGRVHRRFVVVTTARLGEQSWPIEITLASRDAMGFRMLLGREAVRGRFLVHPGQSFLCGRPPKDTSSASGTTPFAKKKKKKASNSAPRAT
jgi:hypothetical protein